MFRAVYSFQRRILSVVVLFVSASMLPPMGQCFAQDESLEDLRNQWSEMQLKFAEKETAISSGEGDVDAARTEFRELVDEANQLILKIKAAAISKLEENAEDKTALRTLMGVLLNDASNEDDGEVLSIGDMLIAKGINPRYFEVAANADRLSIQAKEIFEELIVRQREAQADDLPRVKIQTTKGDVVVELYENQAPNTVANFISLVESDSYQDMLFHRVLEGFMAQTGGFKADGSGGNGPGYNIACECYTPEARPHFTNCLSMAHTGQRDSGGSQFFLTFARTDFLDGKHTCFGRVVEGADILSKIARTHLSVNGQEQPIPNVEKDKIIKAEVVRKRDHDYVPEKIGESKSEPEEKQPPVTPDGGGETKSGDSDSGN